MTPDHFGLHPVFQNAAGARADLPAALAGPRPAVDDEALAGYLCFSHIPTPRSIFSGVERLPALLPWRSTAAFAPPDPTALRRLLQDAIASRLPDEPVAVFLSGGLDSSLVAALLVEAGASVTAFTLDFGAPHDLELPCARAVAAHLKIPLHIVDARPAAIVRALDDAVRALPQPFGDGVIVPLWLLGNAAKDHARVVFNGEGGDQLFGGWANKPMIAAGLYGAFEGEIAEYRQTYHRFDGLLGALWPAHPPIDVPAYLSPHLDPDAHPTLLHRLRAANIALKGAQNIAPRCAALAQCHGLHVAAPFFDEPLAAATFALPPDAFLDGACEKALLKRVAAEYLPDDIVWREKRGMGAPTADWCLDENPVQRRVRSLLGYFRLRREGRFDPGFVRALQRGQDPSPAAYRRRRTSEKLWTLALWEAWRAVHGLA